MFLRIFILSLPVALMPHAYAGESTSSSGAEIITPLNISITRNMSFGVIAPSATESGTVQSKDGCSASITCLGDHYHGYFEITGEPGRSINIPKPDDIILSRSGGSETMTVSNITGSGGDRSSWVANRIIPSDGDLAGGDGNGIQGTLLVNANQAPGAYTGSFTLTVEYQ